MGISLGSGPGDARSSQIAAWRSARGEGEDAARTGRAVPSRPSVAEDGRGVLVFLGVSSWLAASVWRHSYEDGVS